MRPVAGGVPAPAGLKVSRNACHGLPRAENRPKPAPERIGGAVVVSRAPGRAPGGPGAVLRCGAVLAFARLVDLVGALACPLAAGTSAVPGGVQLVGNLRP